ncbi:hypothetical protein H9Q13_17285 [Pontibacter sp. JH31]|uniref:Peptidase MA superfamily protein n=1 Tax=Pontibacter aquaedesilientis TaxID=2766980 RepID=A0ABR7XKV5_9BACT|nr:hypothetical protein [Pontibacter aquaedesilientis]MBD1398927.1 hypothetical protein [Pontibacter aquaedesilientis]
MAERYTTGNAHAESFFTVFGRHVVVTETGLNTDIISHELAHVALFDRIPNFKWYMMTYRVPVWFDEGIAMQVDYREIYSTEKYLRHTDNGAKAPTLVSMASISDFYQPDTLGWYRYATSKHEVARWLQKVDRQGLDQLIQSTTIFSDFDEQYQFIEAAAEK